MTTPDPDTLRAAIFEIIDNQLRDGTPPETRETFDRLRTQGYSQEETLKLIGCVVVSEIFDVLKEGRPYDNEAYVRALHALPRLPWDTDARP